MEVYKVKIKLSDISLPFLIEDEDDDTVTIYIQNFNELYEKEPDYKDTLSLSDTHVTDLLYLYELSEGDILKDNKKYFMFMGLTLLKRIKFKNELKEKIELSNLFEDLKAFTDEQKNLIQSFLLAGEIELKAIADRLRAPVGGVNVEGQFYPGGQFIPGDVVAELSEAEKEGIAEGKDVEDIDVINDEEIDKEPKPYDVFDTDNYEFAKTEIKNALSWYFDFDFDQMEGLERDLNLPYYARVDEEIRKNLLYVGENKFIDTKDYSSQELDNINSLWNELAREKTVVSIPGFDIDNFGKQEFRDFLQGVEGGRKYLYTMEETLKNFIDNRLFDNAEPTEQELSLVNDYLYRAAFLKYLEDEFEIDGLLNTPISDEDDELIGYENFLDFYQSNVELLKIFELMEPNIQRVNTLQRTDIERNFLQAFFKKQIDYNRRTKGWDKDDPERIYTRRTILNFKEGLQKELYDTYYKSFEDDYIPNIKENSSVWAKQFEQLEELGILVNPQIKRRDFGLAQHPDGTYELLDYDEAKDIYDEYVAEGRVDDVTGTYLARPLLNDDDANNLLIGEFNLENEEAIKQFFENNEDLPMLDTFLAEQGIWKNTLNLRTGEYNSKLNYQATFKAYLQEAMGISYVFDKSRGKLIHHQWQRENEDGDGEEIFNAIWKNHQMMRNHNSIVMNKFDGLMDYGFPEAFRQTRLAIEIPKARQRELERVEEEEEAESARDRVRKESEEARLKEIQDRRERIANYSFAHENFDSIRDDILQNTSNYNLEPLSDFNISESDFLEYVKNANVDIEEIQNSNRFIINTNFLEDSPKDIFNAMALNRILRTPTQEERKRFSNKDELVAKKEKENRASLGFNITDAQYRKIVDTDSEPIFKKLEQLERYGLNNGYFLENVVSSRTAIFSKELMEGINNAIVSVPKSVRVPSAQKNDLRRWYYDNTTLDTRTASLNNKNMKPAQSIEQFQSNPEEYYINGINEPLPDNINVESFAGRVEMQYVMRDSEGKLKDFQKLGEISFSLEESRDTSPSVSPYTEFGQFEKDYNSTFQKTIRKSMIEDDRFMERQSLYDIFDLTHAVSVFDHLVYDRSSERTVYSNDYPYENLTKDDLDISEEQINASMLVKESGASTIYSYHKDFFETPIARTIGLNAFDTLETVASFNDDAVEYLNDMVEEIATDLQKTYEDDNNWFKAAANPSIPITNKEIYLADDSSKNIRPKKTKEDFETQAKILIANAQIQDSLVNSSSDAARDFANQFDIFTNMHYIRRRTNFDNPNNSYYAGDEIKPRFKIVDKIRDRFYEGNFEGETFSNYLKRENDLSSQLGETLIESLENDFGIENLRNNWSETGIDRYTADSPFIRALQKRYFNNENDYAWSHYWNRADTSDTPDREPGTLSIGSGNMNVNVRAKGLYSYLRRKIMNIADENFAEVTTSAAPTNHMRYQTIRSDLFGADKPDDNNNVARALDKYGSYKKKKIADYYFSFGSGDTYGRRPPKK